MINSLWIYWPDLGYLSQLRVDNSRIWDFDSSELSIKTSYRTGLQLWNYPFSVKMGANYGLREIEAWSGLIIDPKMVKKIQGQKLHMIKTNTKSDLYSTKGNINEIQFFLNLTQESQKRILRFFTALSLHRYGVLLSPRRSIGLAPYSDEWSLNDKLVLTLGFERFIFSNHKVYLKEWNRLMTLDVWYKNLLMEWFKFFYKDRYRNNLEYSYRIVFFCHLKERFNNPKLVDKRVAKEWFRTYSFLHLIRYEPTTRLDWVNYCYLNLISKVGIYFNYTLYWDFGSKLKWELNFDLAYLYNNRLYFRFWPNVFIY